jgi:5-hydroxytryptamine receptor 3
MLVDLGSFYLPPNCCARIVFKTNVLVGYTVFRVNMSDEVPRSTGSISLIGKKLQAYLTLLSGMSSVIFQIGTGRHTRDYS